MECRIYIVLELLLFCAHSASDKLLNFSLLNVLLQDSAKSVQ